MADWIIRDANPEAADEIGRGLGVSSLLAKILAARGFTSTMESRNFLTPRLKNLPDPLLIPGMAEGSARVARAVISGERLWIYSDFDVDGVTCAALLKIFFDNIGADAETWLPRRDREGYGLHVDPLRHFAAEGGGLVLTADCGISSFDEAAEAKLLGLDLVITDHHTPGDSLPACEAVVNPRIEGSKYPDPMIAGVGVAWNLAVAVKNELKRLGWFNGEVKEPDMREYLDLVAMGTVADLVPLTGVNRILVSAGLGIINRSPRPAVSALAEIAMLRSEIRAGHLAFQFGPRINAAGRMDSPDHALHLLLADTMEESRPLAQLLDDFNRARRAEENETYHKALNAARQMNLIPAKSAIVVEGEGFHPGVIGIVASRLVERFNRPSVVISINGNEAKGSARSAAGLDLYELLTECSETLIQFGGHKGAAGVTLETRRVGEFRQAFEAAVNNALAGGVPEKKIIVDTSATVRELTLPFMAELARMEPFGAENPTPLLLLKGVVSGDLRYLGDKSQHLKLRLESEGRSIEAILWERAKEIDPFSPGTPLDVVGSPRTRHYGGRTYVQFQIKDLRSSES
ncbi:MAG: single-stranded-DNA-specific exonuclease RecJ [Deltaproteobacteria bacterium]|nr:MAG: single-stranded-DNA-specific exonuclease RecJ [Deltaproteobacteria bacterium]